MTTGGFGGDRKRARCNTASRLAPSGGGPDVQVPSLPQHKETQPRRAKLSQKERELLEGYRWAQLGKWAARRVFLRPSRRAASTLLLVLFLLAPYGASLSLLFERDSSNCGMSCCKGTKACCCRKSSHKAHQGGPTWAPSSQCPDGCGQLPATQGSPVASLGAAGFETAPVIVSSGARWTATQRAPSALVAFALFERPPPVSA